MSFPDTRWMVVPVLMGALLTAGCASTILNPHPPPDPESLSLSQRRAMTTSPLVDPDPPTRSMWDAPAVPATAPAPKSTSEPVAVAAPRR